MNATDLPDDAASTLEDTGVELGTSSEGFPVARLGDLLLAMLPHPAGGGFLASAWRLAQPLSMLRREDFFGHDGELADEAAFRSRVLETAQHQRELSRLQRLQTRMVCSTPWGPSQLATIYAEGIVAHMTAGHGGFRLSAERNKRIVRSLRIASGWYEEDDAWAIVALTFPNLFTTYERQLADRTIRDKWPDEWEAISGRPLKPGESSGKDRRAFERCHAGDWIVASAITSGHHHGKIEVVALRGGRRGANVVERRFLVPKAEYEGRGPFGFVIDEGCHAGYDGASSFVGWERRKAS
ncbi:MULTISPECIES: DUF7007 domain-containing protein [unclassified Shinella]|uniref:DUF7007 domain-containing protein n=1 Tax=unclassified Shinella TaxID=2643062 RepID=UPI00225D553E|nr:hypothetical protein [Shinella sp. YE25]MDC7260207.1 hypothetical protein [Shinella sp. YE25]CAI0341193.1 conserved hypothetical protein [Rhizobiaceae bacterium]CAK7262224.1 conserved protein of unknown function [Shinella sp. WSC3-e]